MSVKVCCHRGSSVTPEVFGGSQERWPHVSWVGTDGGAALGVSRLQCTFTTLNTRNQDSYHGWFSWFLFLINIVAQTLGTNGLVPSGGWAPRGEPQPRRRGACWATRNRVTEPLSFQVLRTRLSRLWERHMSSSVHKLQTHTGPLSLSPFCVREEEDKKRSRDEHLRRGCAKWAALQQ